MSTLGLTLIWACFFAGAQHRARRAALPHLSHAEQKHMCECALYWHGGRTDEMPSCPAQLSVSEATHGALAVPISLFQERNQL